MPNIMVRNFVFMSNRKPAETRTIRIEYIVFQTINCTICRVFVIE